MIRLLAAALAALMLVPGAASAQQPRRAVVDDGSAALQSRLRALDADPERAPLAAYERLRAQQAIEALVAARGDQARTDARHVAEWRVEIVEDESTLLSLGIPLGTNLRAYVDTPEEFVGDLLEDLEVPDGRHVRGLRIRGSVPRADDQSVPPCCQIKPRLPQAPRRWTIRRVHGWQQVGGAPCLPAILRNVHASDRTLPGDREPTSDDPANRERFAVLRREERGIYRRLA